MDMKLKELLVHIDGCFKIWLVEKDRETDIGRFDDKWDIPEELENEKVENWICCENLTKIALDI